MSQHATAINAIWTVERIEQLRQLAGKGLSSAQIGRVIGASRSAIIGKLRRLDIPLMRAQRELAKGATPRPRRERKPPIVAPGADAPAAPAPPLRGPGIPFEDAGAYACRYPLWGDSAATGLVCGANTESESPMAPYCATHRATAFQPSRPRASRAEGFRGGLKRSAMAMEEG